MPRYGRSIAAILILAVLVIVLNQLELSRYVGFSQLKSLMARVAPYEPLVFIAFCAASILLRLPVIFLIALAGGLFGVPGLLYSWVGCILGTFTAFLLARYALKDFFQRKIAPRFPWLNRIDERIAVNGLQTILLLRLLFFMSFPLNWILGVSRVRFRDYAIGTMIGPLPLMGLLNYWGGQVAAADSLWVLAKPEILLPGALVLLLAAGGGVAGRRLLLRA